MQTELKGTYSKVTDGFPADVFRTLRTAELVVSLALVWHLLLRRGADMNATDVLQGISESLGTPASAKSVFGEPIQADGKTVVPVAKVAYGFCGRFGSGKDGGHPDRQGEGGGGGGGVRAFPAGALEITSTATRFVPFTSLAQLARQLAVAFAAGVVFGTLILPRRRG